MDMKSVILAAGRGTRMPEITKDIPKCLIEINGKTILERQLEILNKNNIEKTYIVIGYKANKIRSFLKSYSNIKTIENKDFEYTDNIYSLYLTSEEIKDNEFILINGDAVFDEEIIKKLASKRDLDVAPFDSQHYDLEELKIKGKNGRALEILPKNSSKEISDGSTIGVFKFSSNGSKTLFDEIQSLITEGIKNKWFEHALNNIFKKIDMHMLDIHGYKWIEIDDINDIKKAEEMFG